MNACPICGRALVLDVIEVQERRYPVTAPIEERPKYTQTRTWREAHCDKGHSFHAITSVNEDGFDEITALLGSSASFDAGFRM